MILRIHKADKLFLYQLRQPLTLLGGSVIKNLRPVNRLLMVAVLVNAHHTGRLFLIDQLTSALHVLGFFVGGILIIQAPILLPGHHHLYVLLFQKGFQLSCNLQIQILLLCPVHTDFSRIISSMAGVQNHQPGIRLLRLPSRLLPEAPSGKIAGACQNQDCHPNADDTASPNHSFL